MAEILLFHHAHGLTPGIEAFAERLRQGGHSVHVPDLYDGRIFTDLEEGIAYAQEIGFDTVTERGVFAARDLPTDLAYVGFSVGVLPAQRLAQTRMGATGAVLISGCVPPSEFGTPWPPGLPVEIHIMEDDPLAAEGDLDAAHSLVETADRAELFLYHGDAHLFADRSLLTYDQEAADLLNERALDFLAAIDVPPV